MSPDGCPDLDAILQHPAIRSLLTKQSTHTKNRLMQYLRLKLSETGPGKACLSSIVACVISGLLLGAFNDGDK